jgi:hypothetical protein
MRKALFSATGGGSSAGDSVGAAGTWGCGKVEAFTEVE